MRKHLPRLRVEYNQSAEYYWRIVPRVQQRGASHKHGTLLLEHGMAAGAPVPRGVGQDGAYFVRCEGDVAGREAFVRTEYRRGVGLRVRLGSDYE